MRKKLTPTYVSAIAIFLAWAITSAEAHVAGPGEPCPHKDPNHPHCTSEGGGGGNAASYEVSVVQGTFVGTSPVYRPADLDSNSVANSWEGDYNVVFPRHDLCATVTVLTPTGDEYLLTDDIVITVNTQAGCITSLQLRGQDTIAVKALCTKVNWSLSMRPHVHLRERVLLSTCIRTIFRSGDLRSI
jgi:hypothetical protein